jgi:uncharacterized protein (TIGR02186 family)
MIRAAFLLMLLLSSAAAWAVEPKLVPDVSQRKIYIQSGFTGAKLLMFGAIIYPKGIAPDGPIDVAVVLRGPTQAVTLREKEKYFGIWLNARSSDFQSAPTYYAIASSRPINKIVDAKTAAIYELGLNRIQLSPSGEIINAEQERFMKGLVALNQKQGLYRQAENKVEVTDNVLYRVYIDVPSSVPVGKYTAETLLIRDGRVIVADDSVEVEIQKTGFEQLVTVLAQQYSLLYGLLAVALSLALGWAAGFAFRRF